MTFQDSKTYANLQKSFTNELQANGKYALYADDARQEGYIQIGNVFVETSFNEREHANLFLNAINQGVPTTTLENLKEAISGETVEWTKMYEEYARMAALEGYEDISNLFSGIANIERHHDERFIRFKENIETNQVFQKPQEVVWICLQCGFLFWSKNAPVLCPVCGYPQGYYQVLCENF